MKNLFLLIFLFISSIAINAQIGTTVSYQDNFGPITLAYNGSVNGKESYQGTDAGATVTVSWSGTQWEIYINVGSGEDLSFTSATLTSSNPPDFSIGNWVDANAGDGTSLVGLSGTGTTSIVLPVELVGFEAIKAGKSILLNWVTASEENNRGFDVQRSINGDDFESLTFVEGGGTTYEANEYSFVDTEVQMNQKYYYRLKQIDFDGQFEYSDILVAEFNGIVTKAIYPNPTKGNVQIEYTAEHTTNLTVSVYSVMGQEMIRIEKVAIEGTAVLDLDFTSLSGGNYFVKLQAGEDVQYQKLVIE